MNSTRYSKVSDPVREWHWDKNLGEVVFDRIGWPAAGEPISDDIASSALDRGEPSIIVQYLREHVAPAIEKHGTSAIHKLADMLERRPNLNWHLKLCRSRPGSPSNPASTLCANLELGRQIHKELERKIAEFPRASRKGALKRACEIVRSNRDDVGKTRAYQAYQLYVAHLEFNKRYEPIPIPERVPRRRSALRKQLKK